jgi:arsenate reductase (thioredoxin)
MKKLILPFVFTLLLVSFTPKPVPMETTTAQPKLYHPLDSYIASVTREFDQIPEDRKKILKELARYVQSKTQANEPVRLTFICTHNSRRSHLSQIWAQTAAYYYGIRDVETYSGGTEATAFNARAVKAMQKAGFKVEKSGDTQNPVYLVKFSDEQLPVKAYSKTYDADGNPADNFAAVMTCSQADQTCPFIPGASRRISLPYDDPKDFDGTPQEEAKYDERTRQIARELFYAFSQVK